MAGAKGRSGTNRGRGKPFLQALDMEIAAAGDDLRSLRLIARKLLDKAEGGDLTAISMVADRLDGKPGQSLDVLITRAAKELSDDELADIAVGSGEGAVDAPHDPQVTH